MAKKILIADDSLFMRTILKDILSDQYKIVEAESGAQTEQKFKEENPDLVLLDIIMPGGEEEGIKVLQKIMKANPKTKVVMISAVGQDAIVNECKELGALDFIIKPFDREEVIKVVHQCLD